MTDSAVVERGACTSDDQIVSPATMENIFDFDINPPASIVALDDFAFDGCRLQVATKLLAQRFARSEAFSRIDVPALKGTGVSSVFDQNISGFE